MSSKKPFQHACHLLDPHLGKDRYMPQHLQQELSNGGVKYMAVMLGMSDTAEAVRRLVGELASVVKRITTPVDVVRYTTRMGTGRTVHVVPSGRQRRPWPVSSSMKPAVRGKVNRAVFVHARRPLLAASSLYPRPANGHKRTIDLRPIQCIDDRSGSI